MTEKKNRDDKAGRHDDRAEGHADVRRQRRPGWEHDIVTKQGDTPMTEQRGDDDNRAGGWWQRKGTRMTSRETPMTKQGGTMTKQGDTMTKQGDTMPE